MALFGWRWRKPKPTERRESEVTTGADVAQLVKQLTRNEQVVRSSRIVGAIYVCGTFIAGFETCLALLESDASPGHRHVTFKVFAVIGSMIEKR